MKKLSKPIRLTIVLQFITLLLIGQNICLFNDTTQPNYPDDYLEPYESKNGWFISPIGTLRVLLVFVEIDYDVGTDPNLNGTDEWPVGELPIWADDILDHEDPAGQPEGLLTRYYYEASSGNCILLGDYLVAPTNNGVFKILMSDVEASNHLSAAVDEINIALNDSIVTSTGLNNISYFDNWTKTTSGKPNITPSVDNPAKYDHVMFLWRNRLDSKGNPYNGTGNVTPSGFPMKLLGYKADTYSNFGTFKAMPISIARHEYGHLLYGSNDFHSAGGGWGSPYDYWISITGGWSNLGLSGCSLKSWNAWDR